jgi:hypothetical protein
LPTWPAPDGPATRGLRWELCGDGRWARQMGLLWRRADGQHAGHSRHTPGRVVGLQPCNFVTRVRWLHTGRGHRSILAVSCCDVIRRAASPMAHPSSPARPSIYPPAVWRHLADTAKADADFAAELAAHAQYDNAADVAIRADLARLAAQLYDLVLDRGERVLALGRLVPQAQCEHASASTCRSVVVRHGPTRILRAGRAMAPQGIE